jgi:tetratricopeptide (TPR) repeat protein
MERTIADWYSKGIAKQFTVSFVMDQCLSSLETDYRKCIQVAAYFPDYFDVYAISVMLDKEFDKTYEMLLTLQSIGLVSQEPKQFVKNSRFCLHSLVREHETQRLDYKTKLAEFQTKIIAHYKRFAVTMGWLYLRRSESALLAIQLFEHEYVNMRNMMQLLMDNLADKPELTAMALDIVTFRELMSLRFEPDFLIQWYALLRQIAFTKGRNKIEPHHVNGLIDCSNEIGSCLSKLGHLEEAKKQIEIALTEANQTAKYLRGECEAYILLGKLESSDREAAKQFKQAYALATKIRDPILEAKCEEHLGRSLINIHTANAIKILERSLEKYTSYGMQFQETTLHVLLGNCYCKTDGMMPKALEMYQLALTATQTTLQDSILEHYILKRIGTLNTRMSDDPSQPLLYLEKYNAYSS